MRLYQRYGWLIVSLFCLFSNFIAASEPSVSRRNPFAIKQNASCKSEPLAHQYVADLKDWRFQGVIGQGERWLGWLYSERSGWLSVSPGERFIASSWQVLNVTQSFTQFIASQPLIADCITPETISLPLIMD